VQYTLSSYRAQKNSRAALEDVQPGITWLATTLYSIGKYRMPASETGLQTSNVMIAYQQEVKV